ncbi:S8/S53 family peptidase [Spirosoma terrae]|uniref:S8 family serine peptidase n=1 Tax=Spirosoma terrae TaxID=1968276 RepID=A0A6L9LDQ2_9BACT|nr:S8/S53 family peptidase [Spirosoma terrae]NDU98550.1 S8 family serine peptidase [Spirosoma terrae]
MTKPRIAGLNASRNHKYRILNQFYTSKLISVFITVWGNLIRAKRAGWIVLCLLIQQASFSQSIRSDWRTELVQRYSALRTRTTQLAKQQGWPVYSHYATNRQLVLQRIDSLGQPVYYTLHNTEAARATRTQSLYQNGVLQLALSGSSSALRGKIGLWDGGRVLTTHQEFSPATAGPAILQQMDTTGSYSDHATHLAGTLVARGINAQARGMAYGAQLSIWNYSDDISEIAAAAPNLLLSNHAYGPVVGWVYNPSRPGTDPAQKWEWWGNTRISTTEDYLFGFYTSQARDIDQIAANNPFYLMIRSADNKRAETGPPAGTPYYLRNTNETSTLNRSRNDGYDVIPAEATAKNVLTVGAADVTFNQQDQPTTINSTAYSGWGPTDDGRIKPDLLGMGTNVFSTLSDAPSSYGTYTGTSMASANVTGSLVLLQELYMQQKAATSTNSTQASQFMRSATLKGLALHTASRTTPATGPDYRQGWGLLNTEAAARVILNTNQAHLILERTLESGGTFTQRIVAQGNEPLIITLCWTDPEGPATAVAAASLDLQTPKLINDLDVRVAAGANTFLPFVLDPANPSRVATSGDNIRDNVEQIYIQNPVPGQAYTITVSHKGKMKYTGQPFSIVVSGLYRLQCQFPVSITPGRDTVLCSGARLQLSADNRAGFTYQWLLNNLPIANATTSTYQTATAGAYALRMTDASGCSVTSSTVQVRTIDDAVKITPASTQWLCQDGAPIQLTATSTTSSPLVWLRNGNVLTDVQSTTLNATLPGRYQVRLSQEGCQALSDPVVISATTVDTISLTPEETDLTFLQGATVTLYATTGKDYQYQWYQDNQPIASATRDRFSVSTPGIYKVRITQQTCVGWSTERYVHFPIVTSVAPLSDSLFTIYPNPAEHTIDIQYAYPNVRQLRISVIDQQGRVQLESQLSNSRNGQFQGSLRLNNLATGLYFLKLDDGERTQLRRFIKK